MSGRAEFGQASMAAGEFSESVKRAANTPGRADGRDGKNPALHMAGAAPDRTGETGPEQAAGAPHPPASRTSSVAASHPDRIPTVEASFTDPGGSSGQVSAVVSGSHTREGLTLGVDIGNAGGLALVTRDGILVAVEPMPVLQDGPRSRPTVNAPLLAAIVKRWAPASAYVELVGPRPGEAAGGAFSFGRARGLVEGVLAAQGVPARMVTAPVWKRHCGIPAGRDGVKDLARAEACRRWPAMAERFAAKGSDGLAEAGLIAVAGMAREAER